MSEKKRVGIWVRVSTDRQVEGYSPEHHEERARHYAELKGWTVVELYRLDSMSGKSVWEYPDTKRMLRDIKNGHISGLIFSRLARLARNTKELLEFADIFKASQADLISLAEYIDTSTHIGKLFYTLIAALAEWERKLEIKISCSQVQIGRAGRKGTDRLCCIGKRTLFSLG